MGFWEKVWCISLTIVTWNNHCKVSKKQSTSTATDQTATTLSHSNQKPTLFLLDVEDLNVTSFSVNISISFEEALEQYNTTTFLFQDSRNITDWVSLTSCFTMENNSVNGMEVYPVDSLSFCLENCASPRVLLHQGLCWCPKDTPPLDGSSTCHPAPCLHSPGICGQAFRNPGKICVCEYQMLESNFSDSAMPEENCLYKLQNSSKFLSCNKSIGDIHSGNNKYLQIFQTLENATLAFRQPYFQFENKYNTSNITAFCEEHNLADFVLIEMKNNSNYVTFGISVENCLQDKYDEMTTNEYLGSTTDSVFINSKTTSDKALVPVTDSSLYSSSTESPRKSVVIGVSVFCTVFAITLVLVAIFIKKKKYCSRKKGLPQDKRESTNNVIDNMHAYFNKAQYTVQTELHSPGRGMESVYDQNVRETDYSMLNNNTRDINEGVNNYDITPVTNEGVYDVTCQNHLETAAQNTGRETPIYDHNIRDSEYSHLSKNNEIQEDGFSTCMYDTTQSINESIYDKTYNLHDESNPSTSLYSSTVS